MAHVLKSYPALVRDRSKHVIIKQYERSTTEAESQKEEKPAAAGVRVVQENSTSMTTFSTEL